MKTFTLEKDGSIAVTDAAVDQLGKPKLDVSGLPMAARWSIQKHQIAEHARDPQYFAGAPADVAAAVAAAVSAKAS